MSEENQAETVVVAPENIPPALKPIVSVTHNGVTLDFYPTSFQRAGEDMKGVVYPALTRDYVTAQFEAVKAFFGADVVAGWITSKVKQICQGVAEEVCDTKKNLKGEEEVDWTTMALHLGDFAKEIVAPVSRGESIPALVARQTELFAAISNLDEADPEYVIKAVKWGKEIKQIEAAKAAKRRNVAPKLVGEPA